MAVYTQISVFFISLFLSLPAYGQLKPVTVITSLVPPYTPYLGEYANDTGDKLSVTVVLNDSRVESHPVKLVMYLDLVGAGTVARTSPAAITPVFYLGQGALHLGGADLAAFFLPRNLEFTGDMGRLFSAEGRIPDGLYRIGFQVVDAMRPDVVLSSTGYSAPAWFTLNPPPLPAMPTDGEEVGVTEIQNVRFSWTPRHLGSGNAAFSAEYTFRLYGMRVAGIGKEQTVLSTLPVYTTTTNATSLFLGADAYPLEQGVSYAWTVTAGTGEVGFTLFSNDGRSEARAFTYGCLCPVPNAPLPSSVLHNGATIRWEPDPLHMSFETGFRKAGAYEDTWHNVESYLGESSVNGILAQLTSYEFRVRALCFNGEWSDYSPVNRFTTVDLPKADIECGATDEKVEAVNSVPKPMLYAGEVITYGQWKLILTEVSGSNGIFSGRCDVTVPLFNNARVKMVFNGITVNEFNQVTAGMVRSVASDDSRLIVNDITDYINEGDQIGNITDNAAIAGIELGFSGSGGLTASVSTDGTSVTLTSPSGSQVFSVDNLGDGTTVEDSDGNIFAVTADGEVTQIGAAAGSSGAASSGSPAITDPGSLPIHLSASVTFSAAGKWALDNREELYSGSPFDAEFAMFGDSYVPWKLVPLGKSDKIRATFSGGASDNIDPSKVRFIAADGTEFFAKYSGGGLNLEILGGGERDGYGLFAVYENLSASGGTPASETATGSGVTDGSDPSSQSTNNQEPEFYLLGKLNVASYPLLERPVVIVPVDGASVDASALAEALDGVYSKYGVTWEVTVDGAFTDLSWDTDGDGLDGGGSGPFSAYSAEMRALNGLYSAARGIEDNTVYLFWFGSPAGDNGSLAGDMPLDGPFGYVFAPTAGADTYNTVAHELGHGAFQLRHTFSDAYNVPRYSTDNLMDYPGGPVLKKYQWDLLHDPKVMVAKWAQDEQEGAYYDATLADIWIRNLNNIACGTQKGEEITNLAIEFIETTGDNGMIRLNPSFSYREIPVTVSAISLPAKGISEINLANPETSKREGKGNINFKLSNGNNQYNIGFCVEEKDFEKFAGYLKTPGEDYFKQLISNIPSEESRRAYSELVSLPLCSYEEISITDRIKYFGWLSGELWTNTDQEEIIINLLIHAKNRKELYYELYNQPTLLAKMMLSCDGENRLLFINEITKLCDESWASGIAAKGNVFIGTVPNSFGSLYSGNNFITYAILTENSNNCSVSNYIGNFPNGMFDWGSVQMLRELSNFSCNPLDPVEIISSDGSQGIFPLIYPVNLSQQQGNQQVGQQFAATLNYIGVASSVRILATGSKLAKSVAFIELTKTGIEAIFNDPQVVETLNQTEEGKEFLKYWQIVSVTIDIATIGTDVLENIVKHGPEASKALRAAGKNDAADNVDDLVAEANTLDKINNFEITDLLRRYDDLSDAEVKTLFNKITKTEIYFSSNKIRSQADILQEINYQGITNPYNFAYDIEDLTLAQEALFVRVHNVSNTNRPWLIAIEDFKEFTSIDDIIKKLALPVVGDGGTLMIPTKLSFAKLPIGTKIRKSVARPQDWPGYGHLPGGAIQFEIIENSDIPISWFTPIDDLTNYFK